MKLLKRLKEIGQSVNLKASQNVSYAGIAQPAVNAYNAVKNVYGALTEKAIKPANVDKMTETATGNVIQQSQEIQQAKPEAPFQFELIRNRLTGEPSILTRTFKAGEAPVTQIFSQGDFRTLQNVLNGREQTDDPRINDAVKRINEAKAFEPTEAAIRQEDLSAIAGAELPEEYQRATEGGGTEPVSLRMPAATEGGVVNFLLKISGGMFGKPKTTVDESLKTINTAITDISSGNAYKSIDLYGNKIPYSPTEKAQLLVQLQGELIKLKGKQMQINSEDWNGDVSKIDDIDAYLEALNL